MRELYQLGDRDFLIKLQDRGIKLRTSEGRLRVNAPAGVLSQPLQEELLRRKVRLLALLNADTASRIHVDGKVFPLTYAQERIWLMEQFHPGTPAYNIPEAFVVEASVDLAAWQPSVEPF